MELEILFRDEWLVAVNKPAGQLVHPSSDPQPDDEVTMKILRDQIGEQVRVAHRLDRPTSGVLLFALEEQAEKNLREAFTDRRISKTYWAVVDGVPSEPEWVCELPLAKDPESQPKQARTEFRLLEKLPSELCLVEARPITGRFHQIRRHLQSADLPIVGDYRYAAIERSDALGQRLGTGTRMLLQAKELRLAHPITGEELVIKAPVDPMFEKVRALL
jgi:tRNA pseudouridine65 synthase